MSLMDYSESLKQEELSRPYIIFQPLLQEGCFTQGEGLLDSGPLMICAASFGWQVLR